VIKERVLPGNSKKFQQIATRVQISLTTLGYYNGPIDGIVGKNTRAALSKLQAAYGLPVSGTITPEVLDVLGIQAK
jgi:His-Xaa-Ser repeat protein HxsA